MSFEQAKTADETNVAPTTSASPLLVNPRSWASIFHDMLIHPVQTVSSLSVEDGKQGQSRTLCGAFLMVLLAYAIVGSTQSENLSPYPDLGTMAGSIFEGCVLWLSLGAILYIISGWCARRDLSFSTVLTCVGWAFLPLIFAAPISCLRLTGPAFVLLSSLPMIWMICLEGMVFAACLAVEPAKLLALTLIGAPVFFVSYMFWLSFVLITMAQMFL